MRRETENPKENHGALSTTPTLLGALSRGRLLSFDRLVAQIERVDKDDLVLDVEKEPVVRSWKRRSRKELSLLVFFSKEKKVMPLRRRTRRRIAEIARSQMRSLSLNSPRPPSLAAPPRQRQRRPAIRDRRPRTPTSAATPSTPLARERAGGDDNDNRSDLLARLSALLARADDPASPEPEVDAAEEAATALALELSSSEGNLVLRGFGRAALPPRRPYSLADLRLARVEPSRVLSPVDATLDSVRDKAVLAATAGAVAASAALHPTFAQGLGAAASLFFLATLDAVAANGGLGFLVLDSAARLFSPTYARRVAAHEAGHFLVAYLLGLLPRGYDLSSLSAFRRSRALNVQAGTRLCDVAFRREVSSGKLSSSSVDRAAAVALAGVAAEYCLFRRDGGGTSDPGGGGGDSGARGETGESAEGGLGDIRQLDALLKALAFSQAKADSTVRYALLTSATLLRRHAKAHARLAEAMLRGAAVVECVAVVERELASVADDEI